MEDDTENFQNAISKLTGEEIMVTGLSGTFPNSASVQEFMENLYKKVDMVSDDRNSTVNDPEVPKYTGIVKGAEKFDAQFFKVGYQQAKVLEPMSRKLLEHAYGAIFDSGNTQMTLKGKIIGVFIGSSYADFSASCMYDISKYTEFMVGGSSKSMLANRISYWVDGRGPSYCLDYSCASSTVALEQAYKSMKAGDCDAAVVGGCNLCTISALSMNIKRAGLLCSDGKTKCFDKNGDGYVRSDAISLIFLQKAKDAKRVYAEVYHAQGSYQLKANEPFLPLRKAEDLQTFFDDVYSNIDVDPKSVEYVEANGAGLADADENEAEAVANTFTSDNVVKIGSVKSNMGHSDAASGLCALTKLCLAYHKGEIPGNLHCEEPVKPVTDGKVQVVTENTKFERGYSALNSLSLTGANFHVVLKGHFKEKRIEKYNCEIPRIVLASGRQDSCVRRILDDLKSKQVDAEEIALLHNIFQFDIVGHTGRGYAVLDTFEGNTVAVSESVDYYQGVRPPLWFVYSGMGSQWTAMGADLMRIPTFAAAIERCDKALSPKGIDIVKVLTEPDNKMFDNILHAFVGIGAVQIGLTDILKEMGVNPDFIIGHSLGEMACAYHDDAFTTEELILATYSRGKSVLNAGLVKGCMAAVGMGYKSLVNLCPPEIDIACRNSSESSTISGPVELMKEFVEELTKRGIFARAVPSANIAFHSRYLKDAGPDLLKRLKEIIKKPKLRSKRWISSSVPKEKWDELEAKYSSAEYHTNNLLNPVLFEEMSQLIPDNAVVVEIAPHGLLQAILKRSHPNCTHIPLTRRGHPDGVNFLLNAIGKLYLAGYNPKVDVLFPKVEFPVSTETPLLSHLVEWEHSEDWPVYLGNKEDKIINYMCRNIVFSIHDDDYKYLEGHIRNGINVLPEAAFLMFVWETVAMYNGKAFQDMSVEFKDIQFHSEVIITADTPVRLTVLISKGMNTFEVTQEDKLIVSGIVTGVTVLNFHHKFDTDDLEDKPDVKLTTQDIYRVLKMRGYDYKGSFQSILTSNLNRNKALIKWTGNWVPFLDSLIQMHTVSRDFNGLSKPKLIRRLQIFVNEHENVNYNIFNGIHCYDAKINNIYAVIRCAGVKIEDITYTDLIVSDENMINVIESRIFFPFYPTGEVDIKLAIKMNMQIIAENSSSKNILITKVMTDEVSKEFEYFDELVNNNFLLNSKIITVKEDEIIAATRTDGVNRTDIIVLKNLLQCPKKMKNLQKILLKDSFILSFEDTVPKLQHPCRDIFNILSCMSDGKKILVLLKMLSVEKNKQTSYIHIRHDDAFSWVSDVLNKLNTQKRIILVSETQLKCGVLGVVSKLKENGYNNISAVIIDDVHAPKFDFNNDFYKYQLQKDMTINVLKKGQWGSYHLRSSSVTAHQKHFELKNISNDSDNVSWIEKPSDDKHVQVCYSGLSANNCNEIVSDDRNNEVRVKTEFGMEFSGIDKDGAKIMGLIAGGSIATSVEIDPDLTWQVPNHWTLEDAATVPLAYVQAYYCLTIRSELGRGNSVLILDGTSSVGLALISLFISFDSIIFAVVDSKDKKDTLLNLFPELNGNKVICSTNDDFYSSIMTVTEGKGCDFVINFGAGLVREAAANCVGFFGCLLDFSKQDILENRTIGMSFLTLSRSYMTVDIANIFRPEYSKDRKILQQYITDGIKSGIVKPLIRMVFSPLQVNQAFKMLTLNKETGKILIRVKDPTILSNGLQTIPRLSFTSQDVLVIVCDEKGVAIEVADRFISRGARKIILHMKSSVSGYLHTKFLTWSKQEVSIKLSSDNLETEKGSETLMKNAMKFGKVKGIFVVFDPKETDNGMKEDFINAYKKQSVIVMNLDIASRNLHDLSHFVVISRFTQSLSDEYALSLIERVCDERNEMGLPTLVVRYEALVELDDYTSKIEKMKPQTVSEFFNAIESGLKLKYKNIITFRLNKENKKRNDTILDTKKGMFTFYKHVDTEEDNVTSQRLVEIPTLLSNGLNTDWDANDSYIILIPGFEERPEIFESVAERFKMKAIAVKLGPDSENKNIQTIAFNAREELKRRLIITNKEKFCILGYSFGVNIALELAAILEKEGTTGIVHCIDGSPDAIRVIIDCALGEVSEDQLQNLVFNHIYKLITGENSYDIEADLKKLDSYEEKIEECLRRMKGIVNYSMQYKKHLIESAYKRIIMAREYKPEMKLKSEIILMKSSVNLSSTKLADDYGLSKYTEKPVKVFKLEADHATAPQDIRVSNIVNRFADKDVINKFSKRNLCDVYV